jgi:hypothetical protein
MSEEKKDNDESFFSLNRFPLSMACIAILVIGLVIVFSMQSDRITKLENQLNQTNKLSTIIIHNELQQVIANTQQTSFNTSVKNFSDNVVAKFNQVDNQINKLQGEINQLKK